MKYLIFTDPHFGKNDDFFLNYQLAFNKSLINVIQKEKVNEIIILGDVFDKRKILDIKVMNEVIDSFSKLFSSVEHTYIITGNHDCFFKTTNDYTSLKIFENINNVTLIKNNSLFKDNILFVPWINENNSEQLISDIKKYNTKENILVGHFELDGFIMDSGSVSNVTQMYETDYNNYKMVLSGHCHSKQTRGNVQYLGSPYQLTHGEYGDHGIYILNDELQFIQNKKTLFTKYTIDKKYSLQEIEDMISGHYVQINFHIDDSETIENVLDVLDKKNIINKKINYKSVELSQDDSVEFNNEIQMVDSFLSSIKYDSEADYNIFCNLFKKYYERAGD